jgi:hypothetical protein
MSETNRRSQEAIVPNTPNAERGAWPRRGSGSSPGPGLGNLILASSVLSYGHLMAPVPSPVLMALPTSTRMTVLMHFRSS